MLGKHKKACKPVVPAWDLQALLNFSEQLVWVYYTGKPI